VNRWIALGLAALLFMAGASLADPGKGGKKWEKQQKAELVAALDAALKPYAASFRFSGNALVAQHGEVLFERGYGLAHAPFQVRHDADTRFKLHSLTKPLTATLVMNAVEAGEIGLDDKVSKWLDGWPPSWDAVTLRHLLGHRSGVPEFANAWLKNWAGDLAATWKKTIPDLANVSLQFKPGDHWRYCNMGYVFLALALEKALGKPIAQLFDERLFKPLEMKNAGLETTPPWGELKYDGASVVARLASGYNGEPKAIQVSESKMYAIAGAGGVYATARDLAAFAHGVFEKGFLGPETLAEMTALPEGAKAPYALGWGVGDRDGRKAYRHDGGDNGFVTSLEYFPESGVCVVILSNYGFAPIGEIRAAAAEAALKSLAKPGNDSAEGE